MSDIQCRFGHWFSPKFSGDNNCPYCNSSEQELQKTQAMYPNTEAYPKTEPIYDTKMSSRNGAKDSNKTVPHYFGADEYNQSEKQQEVQSDQSITPIRNVVGWLVCIDGPEKGKDYRITVGRNFIGRNSDRQINIQLDESISRDIHAEIMFEPNEQQFMFVNGNSAELSYLNGKVIVGHQILTRFDKIAMGKSKFLFVPLCGDDFNWKTK